MRKRSAERPTLHRLFGPKSGEIQRSNTATSFTSTIFGRKNSKTVQRSKSVHFDKQKAELDYEKEEDNPSVTQVANSPEPELLESNSPKTQLLAIHPKDSSQYSTPDDPGRETQAFFSSIYAKLCLLAQVSPDDRISSNTVFVQTAIEMLLDGFGNRFETDRLNLLQLRKDVSLYVISKEAGYDGGEIHPSVQETEDLVSSVKQLVQELLTEKEEYPKQRGEWSVERRTLMEVIRTERRALEELQKSWKSEKASLSKEVLHLIQENEHLRRASENGPDSKEPTESRVVDSHCQQDSPCGHETEMKNQRQAIGNLSQKNASLLKDSFESSSKMESAMKKAASLRSEVQKLEQIIVQLERQLETKEQSDSGSKTEIIQLQVSNNLALGNLHKLVKVTFEVLHPLLSDEASEQIGDSQKRFVQNSILDDSSQEQFSILYSFLITALRELVKQFRKNEYLLESELEDRATCHQQVLDSYTKILQQVLTKQHLVPKQYSRRKRHSMA